MLEKLKKHVILTKNPTLHSKLITPPLGSVGGMAAICHTAARGVWAFECPFVRLGVGLARLCHATWGVAGERLSCGPAGGLQIRTTSICTGGGDGSRLSCA